MHINTALVFLLNFVIDFLLLLGVSKCSSERSSLVRLLLASTLGGGYGFACLLPKFVFFSSALWRVVSLVAISMIAFGFQKQTIKKCLHFTLLNMALGGVAMLLGAGSFGAMLLCAVLVCVATMLTVHRGREFSNVELVFGDQTRSLIALHDTGNVLMDPLTGESVLVAGSDIAREMFGLTEQQLRNPADTLLQPDFHSFRLIPYRTIDRNSGLLLAVKMDRVMVNGNFANRLVAFAPMQIGNGNQYQALMGG